MRTLKWHVGHWLQCPLWEHTLHAGLSSVVPSSCIDNRAKVVISKHPWQRIQFINALWVSHIKFLPNHGPILAKAHVCSALCNLSTLDAHGYADVCLVQSWGIIDLSMWIGHAMLCGAAKKTSCSISGHGSHLASQHRSKQQRLPPSDGFDGLI